MTRAELKALFSNIVSSGTFWGGVGAIAGVAAAVAAFITILASNSIRTEELESRRPYFAVKEPKFEIREGKMLLNINVLNQGVRPAAHVTYEMDVVPVHLAEGNPAPENALPVQGKHQFEHSSDLLRNIPFPWWLDYPAVPNIAPLYFKLIIRYSDGLLDKDHKQIFFMRWDGVQDGSTKPDLVFASKRQATEITEYLMHRKDAQ